MKVTSSVMSMETPIFDGNRIYYNFVRPHEGLDGKTPAEAAGIGIKGGWEAMIRKSIDYREQFKD